MSTFRVSADIEYLDGSLSGMVIPAGFATTYPDQATAYRAARFLNRVCATDDFIRAAVTGNRYMVRSPAMVDEI